MLVIGLTGGIGSGKSTVADMFAKKDVPIIDADASAHMLTEKDSPAFKKIVSHFGPHILNDRGELNRSQIRTIIFSNPNERLWLEQLLHPLIKEDMKNKLDVLSAPYTIAVIPLLLEVEFYSFINRILVIDCPEEDQIKRVMARDQMSEENVKAILSSQASREQRRLKAHDIITNNGHLDHLKQQVNEWHETYLRLAKEPHISS